MTRNIVVKGYQIHHEIESVGFRNIYSALHLKTGKEVFITLISLGLGRDFELLKKRAKMSRMLKNPSLLTAIDCGVLAGDRFFYTHASLASLPIMRRLEEITDKTEALFTTVAYFIDALEALDFIHEADVCHRDLSTNQIRVTPKDKILLEGFINARPKLELRNIANMVFLPYMAAEQLLGAPVDMKTDIYSMGIILYELLTGKLPYDSNYSKIESMHKGICPSARVLREELPIELDNILMRSLSPRKTRYPYVREWINDLEEFYDKRSFRMKMREVSSSVKNLFAAKS